MSEKLIFHIDVNSAYLSWEAARRVAEGGEDLRLIPSAVGGSREKRTGIILAKSVPAKKYGVATGEPVSMALRKCPQLVLVRPDFKLYQRNSDAFMDICREYAPVVEKFSIDECFLDMSGTRLIYPDPVKTAHEIKDRIHAELGFTVNIGIGRTKLAAKMASDFEKPDRVHTLFPEEIPTKMWPLPVGELFTVGNATALKLKSNGIKTIGDLAQTPVEKVQALIGDKVGRHIHEFANGLDRSSVLAQREDAKGYSISVTLEEDVKQRDGAKQILLILADSVAARMRADEARAYCIGVTIRTRDFVTRSHQKKLRIPTDITSEIAAICGRLFDELWKGTPLRLLGISLTDIERGREQQLSLFMDERLEKDRQVDHAVDDIRKRFGFDIIKRGASIDAGVEVGRKYKAKLDQRKLRDRKKDGR